MAATMEDHWVRYLCKSGQTLFVYNKTTGEHRWPAQHNSETMSNNVNDGEPMPYRELCSVSTQTDDTGCINGCTSLHANAGCVSARASVVEVRMDDLGVNGQGVNSGSLNIINASTYIAKGSQNRLLLPKPIMNGQVDTGSKGITVQEAHINDQERNKQYSNSATTLPAANLNSAQIPSNQPIAVVPSPANNVVASTVPNGIPAQSLQPGNQGYMISGTVHLGNGKFANVLLPASNTTFNGYPVVSRVVGSPAIQANNIHKGVNGMTHTTSNGIGPGVTVLSTVPSAQVAGRNSQETTVIREKYLVNGMIANVQHGAKVINNNLIKIVHSQASNTNPSIASQSVVNAVSVHSPIVSSSSKTVDKNQSIIVNKSTPPFSQDRQASEPKQFVISNVFSYATGDVINTEQTDQASAVLEAEKNTSSEHPRSENGLHLDSQIDQGTQADLVKVKVEPGLEDSSNNNIHKCTYCSRSFANSNSLLVHLRTHTGEKPFKCPHCDKEFRHNSSLKVHVKLHTGEKPYKCCSCDRTFRQKVHLRNHLRTHTEDNKFKCSYCQRGFRHKGNLVSHLLTHSSQRPFRCQTCDRTFSQKAHLESHEQSHCKRKQDICPYCGKEFKFGSSLNLHMRTHTGEKPFKCSLCDMTFRQKQHLIVHVRRHTGEKPFKCVHCSKAFRHDTALRSHLLIHPESKYSQAQAAMFTEEQRMGNIEN